jgi:arylsulfatase A-like enzyme
MEQMLLQLDRRLEGLFAQLAKTFADGNFAVVLTGAHGAPPEPPGELRDRMAVDGEGVAQTVDRVLRAERMGKVRKYIYPFLYLDTSEFRDPAPIRRLAARAALTHPAVAGYFTADGDSSAFEPWRRRFYNSFHQPRSGDVMLSYQPEYVEEYGQNRGISYGSLYNYDARVPLCLFGPQFRAGVYEREVELVDVAPTLARVMGVAPPSSSTGRVLAEALAE